MVACPLCQAQNADAASRCARCGTALAGADASEETTTERLNPDLIPPSAVAPLAISSSPPLVAPAPLLSPSSPSSSPSASPPPAPLPPSPSSGFVPSSAPPVVPVAGTSPPRPAVGVAAAAAPSSPRSGASAPRGPRAWWRAATATRTRKRWTFGLGAVALVGLLTWMTIALVWHFTSMHRRALRRLPRDSMVAAWIDLEQMRALPLVQHLRRASRRIDGSSVLVGSGCTDDTLDRSTSLALSVGSAVQRGEFSDYALVANGSASFERFVSCLSEFDRGFRNLTPTGVLRTRAVYTHPSGTDAALQGQSALQMAWLRDGVILAPSTHLAQALTAWDGEGSNAYDNPRVRDAAAALGRGLWGFIAIDARAAARSTPLASRDVGSDGLRWGLLLETPPFDAMQGIGIGFGGHATRVDLVVALTFSSSAAASRAVALLEEGLRAGRLTTLAAYVSDEVDVLRRVRTDDREHPQAPVLPLLQRAFGALNGMITQVRPEGSGDVVRLRASVEGDALTAIDEGFSAYLSSRARRETESGGSGSWLTGESDQPNRAIVPPSVTDATAGVQSQLDRVDPGVWRVDRIEFVNGSAATEDGGERYRVAARVTATCLQGRTALDASIALQHPWLTDLAGAQGEVRMTRPVDLLFVAATQGWRFERVRLR